MRVLMQVFIGMAMICAMAFRDVQACTCPPRHSGDFTEEIRRADLIFQGKLVSASGPGWNAEFGRPEQIEGAMEVTFQVVKIWKGIDAENVTMSTPGISSMCQTFPFTPVLKTEYLIFAKRQRDGTFSEDSCGVSGPIHALKTAIKALGKARKSAKAPANQDSASQKHCRYVEEVLQRTVTQGETKQWQDVPVPRCYCSQAVFNGAGLKEIGWTTGDLKNGVYCIQGDFDGNGTPDFAFPGKGFSQKNRVKAKVVLFGPEQILKTVGIESVGDLHTLDQRVPVPHKSGDCLVEFFPAIDITTPGDAVIYCYDGDQFATHPMGRR
ncbi:MAG TPA: hypothetical protein VI895_05475 [Bdellovibrionota bacterium]|nr:hypothetical protein [Bdellovibrionota bacterium]